MSSSTPSTPTSKTVYSPVTVACSPVSKVAQRGNLTGLPRNIRDLIAEFYTQIQLWETANLEGTLLITRMTALDLFSNPQKRDLKLDSDMQSLCDSLEATCQEMEQVVKIMFRIKREIEVMMYLQEVKENNHDSTENPLFLTWPISKFGEIVSYISKCYHSELEVRKEVAERIGLSRDLDEFTLYESSWMQDPMLFPEVISYKIEAAMLETGLR